MGVRWALLSLSLPETADLIAVAVAYRVTPSASYTCVSTRRFQVLTSVTGLRFTLHERRGKNVLCVCRALVMLRGLKQRPLVMIAHANPGFCPFLIAQSTQDSKLYKTAVLCYTPYSSGGEAAFQTSASVWNSPFSPKRSAPASPSRAASAVSNDSPIRTHGG